jgi:mRNA interferase MazF
MNRGEIWLAELNPTRGQEIQKTRPAVIISRDDFRIFALRTVVPITGWQPHFEGPIWIVKIEPCAANGLVKVSGVNALQTRSVSTNRLIKKLGIVTAQELVDIVAAVGLVIGYP